MKRYYLIDHRVLFVFGYIFYLFTPYIVGVSEAFSGFPGIELYQGYFKLIPKDKLLIYMLITLSWLPAFFLGHFCYSLVKPYKRSLELFDATPLSRSVSYIGLLLLFVLMVFTFIARHSLFGGYGSYDVGARGKMSTLLVIFNFFLAYQLVCRQKVSLFLIAGTAITAFLLLSMGGRMYVIQTFIILLVYKTSFSPRRWKLHQMFAFLLITFLVGAAFGIWRMNAAFGIDKAAYSFMAEPVFTWFSTSTFLIGNDIPMLNMPWNFLSSFLNLVPNTIISFKPYLVSAQNMGYTYQSPLGADSIWTNVVINFGWLGSIGFMFLLGFLLNFFRHLSERKHFWAVFYMLVCGLLPFQFFRDGFYLLNKQLFFNFLLFPALILLVLKTIMYTQAFFKSPAPITTPAAGVNME
jgi:hypothetical protein